MTNLIEYIQNHTNRGECQCGQCCDKEPDSEAPTHSTDVHFFWVSTVNDPKADDLRRLLEAEYPALDRLRKGLSYIEIGAAIGDQGLALLLIGLGELVGLWSAITPKRLGMDGEAANALAGDGFVMCSGLTA